MVNWAFVCAEPAYPFEGTQAVHAAGWMVCRYGS